MQIVWHGPEGLVDYMSVPIAYWVCERYRVVAGVLAGPEPEPEPWLKDYDMCSDDRPDRYPVLFDVANWGFLAAMDEERRVGGAALARGSPEFKLLEGRRDLVHIVDLRVLPEMRGKGVGTALWHAAEEWAQQRFAVEVRVETQDVNVPACRFYQAMGCTLHAVDANAYDPEINETQIIWSKLL